MYDQLIVRGQNRHLEGYAEKHHIIPKCLGGTDESTNIVTLTTREHFIAHWLLHLMYPLDRKLAIAFEWMTKKGSGKQKIHHYTPSSRTIATARAAASAARIGVRRPDVSARLTGRPVTQSTVEKRLRTRIANGTPAKMSARMAGAGNPMSGTTRPDWSAYNKRTKSRGCRVDGIKFDSVASAARDLGLPHKTLLRRMHSSSFPNCCFLG